MKVGRTNSETPRAYIISVRLTETELEELEDYACRQGMTNAEVIKCGIKMQLNSELWKNLRRL